MENLRQYLLHYAFSFVGKPYFYSGDDPMSGFDCSGFVSELLQSIGIFPAGLRLTAQGIYDWLTQHGAKELILAELGAIVFFGASTKEITHVGFCISSKLMFEAGGGTSETKTIEKASTQNAFVRMRPVANRKDRVALLLPPFTP